MIQHLGRAARFAAADLPSARIEKLGALFAERAASDAAAIPLLAEDAARQAFAAARDIAIRQGAVIFEHRAEASLGEITNIRTIG